jgi:hypothetical protein
MRRYRGGTRTAPRTVTSRLHFLDAVTADLTGGYVAIGLRRRWGRARHELLGGRSRSSSPRHGSGRRSPISRSPVRRSPRSNGFRLVVTQTGPASWLPTSERPRARSSPDPRPLGPHVGRQRARLPRDFLLAMSGDSVMTTGNAAARSALITRRARESVGPRPGYSRPPERAPASAGIPFRAAAG